MLSSSLRFSSGRNRFQADLGAGEFSGRSRNNLSVNGLGASLNLSGSLQLTDQLIVQGRYAYVGANFLSAQSGLLDPIKLAAGGISWQPKRWLTASMSGSSGQLGSAGDFNRFTTATLNLTPSRRLPTSFFSHTQTAHFSSKAPLSLWPARPKNSRTGGCLLTPRASRRLARRHLTRKQEPASISTSRIHLKSAKQPGVGGCSTEPPPGNFPACSENGSISGAVWVTSEVRIPRSAQQNT